METQNRKVKPARKGFVITREATSGGYCHVSLYFVRPDGYDGAPKYTDLRLRWQATDNYSERSDWYGFHAFVETDRIERLVTEGKFAAQLERAFVGVAQQPADWVAKLESLGYVRYVRDGRVSPDLVPFKEVIGADFSRYVPNYNQLGWDSVIVSTVARSETTAKGELLARLADRENHWNTSDVAKKTKEFLDAGMPVMVDRHAHAPDMVATDDALRSPKAREAKIAAAELATAEAYANARSEVTQVA